MARKLIEQAAETKDDPTNRFALLTEARNIAARAGDLDAAEATVTTTAELYRVGRPKLELDTLDVAGKGTAAYASQLTESYLHLCSELLDADELDTAVIAAQKGMTAASKTKGSPLLARAKREVATIAERRRERAQLDAARKTLAQHPDDAEANGIVGRYLCFRNDRWREGAALLVKGSDAELKALAVSELAGQKGVDEITALADRWWTLGQKKESGPSASADYRRRAAHWYATALPDLKGLLRATAQTRAIETLGATEFPAAKVSKYLGFGDSTPPKTPLFSPLSDQTVPDELTVKTDARRIHISGSKRTDGFRWITGIDVYHYGKAVMFSGTKWASGTFKAGVSSDGDHAYYTIILLDTANTISREDLILKQGVSYDWTVCEEGSNSVFRVTGGEKPIVMSIPSNTFGAFGFAGWCRRPGDKVDFDIALVPPSK